MEQRKKSIGQVEVSKDKLHSAVQSGFEKARKERLIKRTTIIKRSSWSIVIATILPCLSRHLHLCISCVRKQDRIYTGVGSHR